MLPASVDKMFFQICFQIGIFGGKKSVCTRDKIQYKTPVQFNVVQKLLILTQREILLYRYYVHDIVSIPFMFNVINIVHLRTTIAIIWNESDPWN